MGKASSQLTPASASLGSQTDFDSIAGIYDSVFPAHITEHYLRIRSAYILKHAPGKALLDVGAGTGLLAERLFDQGLEVTALDPFPEMLARLRKRQPAISTVIARGDAIPYPDGKFDMSYSVAVMHHVADPDLIRSTLAELVRVTRPGGRILIWDHNPVNVYWPIIMNRVPQDTGAERLVPMDEIIRGLRDAGATILRAERRGFMPEFVPLGLMWLARAAERGVEAAPGFSHLCAHNVVLATH